MRPLRLELEGFTVFRQPTTVDFTAADLFALAGPTGAGKTSVIDAVTFALYGAVPRLDRRAVAPIVSQNLTEARVRLDFAVGKETFTAARVVRATKGGGATTKEARLERVERGELSGSDGSPAAPRVAEVLAGNADEVTATVTELLGLTYDHFVTCVSLPQGQFARFLHDKPRDRQDLLVRLLGLGVYDKVASLARQRAALGRGRVDVLEGQLAQLAGVTQETRDEAEARVAELAAVADKLAAAKAGLDELADRTATARRAADESAARVRLLDGLGAPDGVAELAQKIASVTEERSQLAAAEDQAAEAVTAAEAALSELPARRDLEALRNDLVRQDELTDLRQRGQQAADEADEALRLAADGESTAETERAAAAASLERVRVEQRAQALVPQLRAGEPCPVCQQTVHDLPEASSPEVAHAEAALAGAEQNLKEAARRHGDARTHQARVQEKLGRVEQEIVEVGERLSTARERLLVATEGGGASSGATDAGGSEVENLLRRVGEAEEDVERTRQADRDLRRQRSALETKHERLVRQETEARRAFDATRDRLAVLQPPAFDRQNLADDWAGLLDWAAERRPALAGEADRQRELADEAQGEHARRWEELAELCGSSGVSVLQGGHTGRATASGTDGLGSADVLTEAVAVARARAEDAVRRIDADLAATEKLRQQRKEATEQQQVAELLAEHLKANRFEKWLLDEAVLSLAAGASGILGDLSGGAYALSVDPKSGGFTVVDHANASQPRPARTLSGGETFLASLALALALADQVAELATGGTARLEALFLDEGFGTLDPDALDVVATALDELGSRGRMVAIVTHVRELAERLPVRFEVRKVGASSTVERVEAG